jgi:hypothetical protein
MGESREVRVRPNTNCWINFGTGSVSASVAGTSIPFSANAAEYVRVPDAATHFAVIRDSADGFVTLHAVA